MESVQRQSQRDPLVLWVLCPCLPAGAGAAGKASSPVVTQLAHVVTELAGFIPNPDVECVADLVKQTRSEQARRPSSC